MKRITIILAVACIAAYASGAGTLFPNDSRLSPRLVNYQGYLSDTQGNPVTNPSISMIFSIFDAVSSGNQKWTETQSSVSVDRGIFNVLLGGVTPIPDSVFKTGVDRWLELTVAGQTLSPRTRIVSIPYAYSATYSDTALYAAYSIPDLDWTCRITDTADTTLQLGGRWGLTRPGNVAFGNADSTHVNFGTACTTGYAGDNFKYNTISGGAFNSAANRSTVGGGQYNGARGEVSTVGGGSYNNATGWTAVIAGGDHNTAGNQYAFVGGGQSNTASGAFSTVGGGYLNIANNQYATVGGGRYNKARGAYSVVCGGGGPNTVDSNLAIGEGSAIGGGKCNVTSAQYATVAGGLSNTASSGISTVSGGFGNVTSGGRAAIGGGFQNIASNGDAVVGGGLWNTTSGYTSTIGGGEGNTASGFMSAVGGGWRNTVTDSFAFIGSGHYNHNAGNYAAIMAGYADTIAATGDYSCLFGINSNLTQDSTFMVDLPHIRFGKESGGYEFPTSDGTSGQTLVTNGSGQVSWGALADADWTISGSDMYAAASGNIGIGTTTPYEKVHVEGNVLATKFCVIGTKYYVESWGFRASASPADWYMREDANDLIFITADAKEYMRIKNQTGIVGLGTTSPTAKLDVSGTTGYDQVRMRTAYTPTGGSDTNGNVGDIAWDDNYVYVKTSTGWKRSALSSW